MRLSYLAYIHHAIFFSAVVGAMFCGMVIKYNFKVAVREAEERAIVQVYLTTSLKGLSEIRI